MPNRSSRRRNCFCRNALRATSRSLARGRRRQGRRPRSARSSPPVSGASLPRTARRPPRICSRTAAMRSCSLRPAPATAAGEIWRSPGGARIATCDDWGSYVFLRDVHSGVVWSAGFQPSGAEPDEYDVAFHEGRAEFVRRDGTLTTTLEVLVSAEDDAEVRRVSISNSGSERARDRGHLICRACIGGAGRRSRASGFLQAVRRDRISRRRRRHPGDAAAARADRARNLGRASCRRRRRDGRQAGDRDRQGPLSRSRPEPCVLRSLSSTAGRSRTPLARSLIRSLPCAVVCGSRPVQSCGSPSGRWLRHPAKRCSTSPTSIGTSPPSIGRPRLPGPRRRCSSTISASTAGEAGLFQRLAGHLLYAAPTMRPSSETIRRGAGGQPGLWAQGISGDLPIVLLRIADIENLDIARQLLQAHEYWRMKQLAVDLVILNERASSYVQDLQIALETLVRTSQSRPQVGIDGPSGRVFILRADLISAETRLLLASVARVVLVGQRGSLSDQLDRVPTGQGAGSARLEARSRRSRAARRTSFARARVLQRAWGLRRRRTRVCDDPWSRPIDARRPGSMSSPILSSDFRWRTEGGGYTWSVNSRENQLTPWSNDPVADRPGEAFYLRDEDTGDLWSPTASPIRDEMATYVARHGRGYSRFEHTAHGIAADLVQYVPIEDPIKISRLQLRNTSSRVRRLSVTAYAEWVLGPSRTASAAFVTTEIDSDTGAMFARNPWNQASERASRLRISADGRRIGRATGESSSAATERSRARRRSPAADPLSNNVGAGLDPCGALRTTVELPPNGTIELVFFLGQAASAEDARNLIAHYRAADLDAVRSEVDRSLGRRARRGPREDAGPIDGHHAERLAAVSDACLPRLGPLRVLSGERRLWLPRSAAGWHGARNRAPGDDARALVARGRAAVRRGRRPALVAAAFRPGRAHANFRRSCVACLYRRPLCRCNRRRRRSRGGGAVSGRSEAGGGRA